MKAEPYFIKIEEVKKINALKVRLKLAKDDTVDCVQFKRKLDGEDCTVVKFNGLEFYLLHIKNKFYLIENFILDGEVMED